MFYADFNNLGTNCWVNGTFNCGSPGTSHHIGTHNAWFFVTAEIGADFYFTEDHAIRTPASECCLDGASARVATITNWKWKCW